MSRSIPPLNPLHVFEVAARLGNFTKAAEELGVTQSAVSRQIGTLEDYLKVRLFQRDRTGVSLTSAGRDYFEEIEVAFEKIATSTSRMLSKEGPQQLHVSVYPTFAVKWLGPRLKEFNGDFPLIPVRITATVVEPDYLGEGIDLAIRLLPDSQALPGFIKLFSDEIQPVCSPKLRQSLGDEPLTLEKMLQCQLLHSRYRRADWRDWLEANGRPEAARSGIEFASSVLTYQAAIEGLGVAIGQTRLLAQDFLEHKLVPLFDPPLVRPMSYYVVWRRNGEPNYRARSFIYWLQRHCGVSDPDQHSD